MLLDDSGEICGTDMAHVLYGAVLYEETAAADQTVSTVEERKSFSGGDHFVTNVQNGDRVAGGHGDAVRSFP